MNKSFYILFLFFCLSHNFWTQENLVPNPSFEELDSCASIHFFNEYGIINWYIPGSGTSDIFNACSGELAGGVPNNFLGWQEARTGIGYAGLIPYEDLYFEGQTGWSVDSREYLQVELTSELVEGGIYNVSFFTSLGDYYASCVISGLGAYISVESVSTVIPFGILDFDAQVFSEELITDSINWIEIQGEFVADGGEKFLTIGNFKRDSEIQIDCFPDTVFQRDSYYFIDDVTLTLVSINYAVNIPNVISPNDDGVNDEFQVETTGYVNIELKIFNRWGSQIYFSNHFGDNWNCADSNDGVYFYVALLERINGEIDTKNGFIQLVR